MDASAAHEGFVQLEPGPLLAYDAAHSRDLLSRLRTYISSDYAPRVAALRLTDLLDIRARQHAREHHAQ
jgi:hypothetical protein